MRLTIYRRRYEDTGANGTSLARGWQYLTEYRCDPDASALDLDTTRTYLPTEEDPRTITIPEDWTRTTTGDFDGYTVPGGGQITLEALFARGVDTH